MRRLDIIAFQEFGGTSGELVVHLGYLHAAPDGKHEGRYALKVPYEDLNDEALERLRATWQARADYVDAAESRLTPRVVTAQGLSLAKH